MGRQLANGTIHKRAVPFECSFTTAANYYNRVGRVSREQTGEGGVEDKAQKFLGRVNFFIRDVYF